MKRWKSEDEGILIERRCYPWFGGGEEEKCLLQNMMATLVVWFCVKSEELEQNNVLIITKTGLGIGVSCFETVLELLGTSACGNLESEWVCVTD